MFANMAVELTGAALVLSLLILAGWRVWRWNVQQLDRALSEITSLD